MGRRAISVAEAAYLKAMTGSERGFIKDVPRAHQPVVDESIPAAEHHSCRRCSALDTEAEVRAVYGHNWDDPNEDAQGSVQVLLGYECADTTGCLARRRENGAALRTGQIG